MKNNKNKSDNVKKDNVKNDNKIIDNETLSLLVEIKKVRESFSLYVNDIEKDFVLKNRHRNHLPIVKRNIKILDSLFCLFKHHDLEEKTYSDLKNIFEEIRECKEANILKKELEDSKKS